MAINDEELANKTKQKLKNLENRIAAIKSVGSIECIDAINELHSIFGLQNTEHRAVYFK